MVTFSSYLILCLQDVKINTQRKSDPNQISHRYKLQDGLNIWKYLILESRTPVRQVVRSFWTELLHHGNKPPALFLNECCCSLLCCFAAVHDARSHVEAYKDHVPNWDCGILRFACIFHLACCDWHNVDLKSEKKAITLRKSWHSWSFFPNIKRNISASTLMNISK